MGEEYPAGSQPPAFVSLLNQGGQPDTLIDVTSPLAGNVQIVVDGLPTDSLRLEPGQREPRLPAVELRLTSIGEPLRVAELVPMTLRFERAGEATLDVPVRLPYAADDKS